MNNTPLTDAFAAVGHDPESGYGQALCFAASLETRLHAAEAELARSKQLVSERTEQANGFEQALIAAQAELARLKAVFPKVLEALGNGSGCTPTASTEFMEWIPDEVRSVIVAKQAENARLAALVDDQGITLAFVHGVLIVIETSPDDFNMEGLREAIKRVALALTNQDAAMRSGGGRAANNP